MILLDLTHTSHTRARTGIQRVARSLSEVLAGAACPITHDPYLRAWRALEPWEHANLAAHAAASQRGARWPWRVRLRQGAKRFFRGGDASRPIAALLSNQVTPRTALVVPEIFSSTTAAALPALFAAVPGPRIALFHDAIALKHPELTPTKTVARFPAYLQELLAFDGVAAVSDDSRDSLLDYWRWLGVNQHPPVRTLPLGLSTRRHVLRDVAVEGAVPVVLCVGSIEARKNHLALLDAAEALWRRGLGFELHLIGLAQQQTGGAALARIRELQAAGRKVRYDGPVPDAALDAAYARCAFTVYPSLIEGFGLPVLESLAHGKPCVCSARGALGECARGGGCVALEAVDSSALAIAMEPLLTQTPALATLTRAARARTLRTWQDYAADLQAWLRELPRRN